MTFTLLEIDEMAMAFEQTHWHTHHGKWWKYPRRKWCNKSIEEVIHFTLSGLYTVTSSIGWLQLGIASAPQKDASDL